MPLFSTWEKKGDGSRQVGGEIEKECKGNYYQPQLTFRKLAALEVHLM